MSAPKIMWLQSPSPSQSQQQQPLERCVGDNQLTSWPSLSSYSYTYVYMAFKISITIRNTFLHVFNFGIFTVNARRRRPQWRRPLNAFKCGRQRCCAMKMGRTDIWSEQIDYRRKKRGVCGKWNERNKTKKLPSLFNSVLPQSDASSTRQL